MNTKQFWNNRYQEGGDSGYGSYGEQLPKKIKWLSGLDIKSIFEFGCGDFNFGRTLLLQYPEANYLGYDISPYIIEKNQTLYPYASFTNDKQVMVPECDLILCVDVLFHIIDDNDLELMLKNLEKTWRKYLAITAYERDQIGGLSPHVKIRNFDYKRFGEPVIREIVEEDGQLYFYLFKK